jgi:hypothetical protein
MIETNAFRTFIRIYSLFKSESLSASIKLTFHKAMIRSVMTYACPAWESAADTYLLKLQCMQNKVLRTIGNFPRSTTVRNLHRAFNLPYVYDYVTKLCRRKAQVIQNHNNEHVRSRERRSQTDNVGGLNLGVVKFTTVYVAKMPL